MADAPSLAERYVLLGLRLGERVDGLVDSYFGPADLREAATSQTPSALREEAGALGADLDESDLDPQRRRWLAAQVQGLECVAEMLDDGEIAWPDAVRRCYGLDVRPAPEERFEAAHARLDNALPGDGDLASRLQAWNASQNVPPEALLPGFEALLEELRRETLELVELPDAETIEVELVEDKPWSAYNAYQGNLTSRIEINTDLAVRSYFLPVLAAHEVYPGHHTEQACKEARLARELDRVEAAISLIHTPECLVAEGIAQIAIEQAFGEQWIDRAAEILQPLGVPFDADVARIVIDASAELENVEVNIAYFSGVDGWTIDEAIEYHRTWRLSEEERARKSVEFATHPMWSVYVPTYSYGHRLARAFVGIDPGNLRRLLTEQLTTADLVEAAGATSA